MKYPKTHDDHIREKAYLFICEHNLYAEFLTEQGVEFDKERPQNAWYDFIEKHSSEIYTHIYTGFVERYSKKARTTGDQRNTKRL